MQKAKQSDSIDRKILKEVFPEEFGRKNDGKDDENIIHISFFETPEHILEQVSDSPHSPLSPRSATLQTSSFIKFSKLDGTYERIDEFVYEEKTYRPIVDEVYTKGGVNLPTDAVEYETTANLISEIRDFLVKNIELPPMYENLLPYLTLFYWVYEKFPFIPYIQFVGGTGTGKTTAMDTFGSISYKGMDTTGSLTISSIFRLATAWRGTLLIDEFDSVGENSKEMVSFLKSGVSNRIVYRTEAAGKNFDVKAYIVKAPKLFTSERPIEDAGLQSRTIVIKMEKNKKKIPLYKLGGYYKDAQSIRNKLLLWRFRNFDKIDLSPIEFGFPELEVFDRRVQQVITPIYYFSDEKEREQIKLIAKDQEEETYRERRESDEGRIFEIITEKYNDGKNASLDEIAIIINKSRRVPITEKSIGLMVRNIFGFSIDRKGTGEDKKSWVTIMDNLKAIKRLGEKAFYYGISLKTEETEDFVASLDVGNVGNVGKTGDDNYNLKTDQLLDT